MPHFHHEKRSFYLSTSFKVMYSTLAGQEQLCVPRQRRLVANAWRARLGLAHLPHVLVVRDPHARLESFFRDKLRRHPSRAPLPFAEWQPSQRIFFVHLGIGPGARPEEIQERLLALDFAGFVRLVPRLQHLDGHLAPQVETRVIRLRGVPVARIRPSETLKLESVSDRQRLEELLERDLGEPVNPTAETDAVCAWTPELRSIARRVYRRDLRAFRYPARND